MVKVHPKGHPHAQDITSQLHRHTKACWTTEPIKMNGITMRQCAVLFDPAHPDWSLFDTPDAVR